MKQFFFDLKNVIWLAKEYFKNAKDLLIMQIIIAIIIIPISSVASIVFPQKIIDLILNGANIQYIISCALIIELIILFPDVATVLVDLLIYDKKKCLIDYKIKNKIYIHSLSCDYKHFDDPDFFNKYVWTLTNYTQKSDEARNYIVSFLMHISNLVAIITLISLTGPLILAIVMLNVIIRYFINLKLNKIDMSFENENVFPNRKLDYINNLFYEKKYAIDLRCSNLKSYLFKELKAVQEFKQKIIKKYNKTWIVWILLGQLFTSLSYVLVVIYIAYIILNGQIKDATMYITILTAEIHLQKELDELFKFFSLSNALSLSAEKIKEFFSVKSSIENNNSYEDLHIKPKIKLEFKNVVFSYNNKQNVLNNVSFSVDYGEKIAFVGDNGSGKSTIIKLLLRLYDVDSGNIFINGIDIRKYNIKELRKKILCVFQDMNIYAMTIYDYLNLNNYNKINTETIYSTDEINSFMKENGFKYTDSLTKEFNEDGIVPSGGQTQKMILLRIFVNNHPLLILDEPTSALDPIAEHDIISYLNKVENATVIMVSHRLSTVKKMDKIYVVKDGKIVESGNHLDLIERNGYYKKMIEAQELII